MPLQPIFNPRCEKVGGIKSRITDKFEKASVPTICSWAGDRIEQNLIDLVDFNKNTFQISLNRAKSQYEVDYVKKLYGL